MTEEKQNKTTEEKKKPNEKKEETKKIVKTQEKQNPEKTKAKKTENKEEKKPEIKKEKTKERENKETKKESSQEKKEEKKPVTKTQEKVTEKKEYAVVNGKNLPISTKQAVAICKFIVKKKIPQAIKDLEEVVKMKKAVPMKGEIAHKKGKGMMSGKYPVKASKIFIRLLKNLGGNTITNNLDNPIISEAIANQASRPMAKFGRWERKRTHVKIIAKDKKQNKENKKQK